MNANVNRWISAVYVFTHFPTESKTRYVCTSSTGNYPPFEELKHGKRGELCVYVTGTDNYSKRAQRKADKSLTVPRIQANGKAENKNASSIKHGDSLCPLKAFGDMQGTKDALLFEYSEDRTELVVCVVEGEKIEVNAVFSAFCRGMLNAEIEAVRATCKQYAYVPKPPKEPKQPKKTKVAEAAEGERHV